MKAPDKVGMTVNGKRMDLENFLFNVADRPMPKEPTHYVMADVLNTDLSIKRVTVYFNPADTWEGNANFYEWKGDSGLYDNTPQSVGLAIVEHLAFIDRDPNTLAYKTYVVEISSNKVVHEFLTRNFSKCNH